MSYEIANEHGLKGQFASGAGYADFVGSVGTDLTSLKSLVDNGASEDVPGVLTDIETLISMAEDQDVKSTAGALRDLAYGEKMIVITNGMLPDDD